MPSIALSYVHATKTKIYQCHLGRRESYRNSFHGNIPFTPRFRRPVIALVLKRRIYNRAGIATAVRNRLIQTIQKRRRIVYVKSRHGGTKIQRSLTFLDTFVIFDKFIC